MNDDEKKCPKCAETVKAEAQVCKHCGYNFATGESPGTTVHPVPPKSGFSFGKGCLVALGVLVVLIVLGAIVGGGKGDQSSSSGSASASASPPVDVTPSELERAYAANEAAAQQQYGNRPLLVKATIKSIDLGLGDVPFLVLTGSNEFTGPQAHLDAESQKRAGSLSKGQSVTLLCQEVSEVIGTPMLKDCAIQ